MKQGLYSNEWISAEILSAAINPEAYREAVSFIVSLKTLSENFNLVKSYNKTNPTDFVFFLWPGKTQMRLTVFWLVYMNCKTMEHPAHKNCLVMACTRFALVFTYWLLYVFFCFFVCY